MAHPSTLAFLPSLFQQHTHALAVMVQAAAGDAAEQASAVAVSNQSRHHCLTAPYTRLVNKHLLVIEHRERQRMQLSGRPQPRSSPRQSRPPPTGGPRSACARRWPQLLRRRHAR